MGINVWAARSQANRIEDAASDLRRVQSNQNSLKGNINGSWKAEEVQYINTAIQKMNTKISKVSTSLDSIADDIVSVAYEIKREEEERERERERRRAEQSKK